MKEIILVTGSNGFIGSSLVKKLNSEGAKVHKLDRSLLTLPDALNRTVERIKPTIIFHLAAYGNHYDQKDAREIFNANIFGTFNLLQAAAHAGVKCFVNTGSSSEYGRKDIPMTEDMLPEANTLYGAAKVATTYLSKAFSLEFGLPIVTVRPFSVYGPGEAEHRFIPTIIRCCLKRETLKLAPGTHDWIYIDDFVSGIITAAKNVKKLTGEIVNIGTGKQYSNNEVVDEVQEICGITVTKEEVSNMRSFDTITSWVANNDKLKSFGWKPKTDLRSGIKKVIDAKRANQSQKKDN